MAAFKATNLWFDARDLPLVNGCVMAAGGLGAMFATAPVETLLHHTDWRGLFGGLALLTLVVAMALFVIVPEHDDSRPAKRTSLGESIAGVRLVFSDPRFWRVAPVTAASQASFFGIQGLWAGPWMRDVAGLARDMVATHLLAIAASMVAGYVLLGGLATTLTRLGIHARVVAGAGIGIFIGLQAVIVLAPEAARLPVWMLFGFFATTAILYYPILSQSFSSGLAGRVLTGLNVLVFASAFAAQWGMGIIIGLWEADITGRYPLRAYQSGFGLALLVQLVAFVWLIMPRSERAANSRR